METILQIFILELSLGQGYVFNSFSPIHVHIHSQFLSLPLPLLPLLTSLSFSFSCLWHLYSRPGFLPWPNKHSGMGFRVVLLDSSCQSLEWVSNQELLAKTPAQLSVLGSSLLLQCIQCAQYALTVSSQLMPCLEEAQLEKKASLHISHGVFGRALSRRVKNVITL